MFDIGFLELVLIGVVGLIVIGPERLPDVARTVGKWVGRTRRFIANVKMDIEKEIRDDEIRNALSRDASLDEIKKIINDSRFTIEDEINEAKDFVVKARDDDPGRDNEAGESQEELLSEQEKEFDDDFDYGLTDHTDAGADEFDTPANQDEMSGSDENAVKPDKSNDREDSKSNG